MLGQSRLARRELLVCVNHWRRSARLSPHGTLSWRLLAALCLLLQMLCDCLRRFLRGAGARSMFFPCHVFVCVSIVFVFLRPAPLATVSHPARPIFR